MQPQYEMDNKSQNHGQLFYPFQQVPAEHESTTTVSFWKQFNTVLSDTNFGELEAVYKKGGGNVVRNECQKGVDGASRGRRRKKTKVEEEMVLMGSFLKRLVKRVIKQQEVLHNRLLEAIDRMEKERAEWEEGWRRREMEIQQREAIVKARYRDLASKRDSSILSTIQKITPLTQTTFTPVSATTHHQYSKIHFTASPCFQIVLQHTNN